MVDNPALRGGQDRTRIALGEPHEVRYWTQALGITSEQLSEAVTAVGHQVSDVRDYLDRNRNTAGAQ